MFQLMNGYPLTPCYSSLFFYSTLLQRNRHFRIFHNGKTIVESLLHTYSLLLLMYSYNWWNFIFLPNENSNEDSFLIRELLFAIFNRSLSVQIRYRFWTYWLLPSTFPTLGWSFRPGVTYVISGLSKKFLSHSFSLPVNSFFGLPAFDWVGLNLYANAEMTSLRFLGLFGSVFATFWMLLDLMWTCEKAEFWQ